MKEAAVALRRTRSGRIVLALLAIVAAYIFASLAIDTARILYYFLAILLVIMAIRWVVIAFKR
jgi:hypothetical protein